MKVNNVAFEKGRYLYADYSPFDENKNFLNMLRDFVNLSSKIFQIHADLEVLQSALRSAESLQREMISKIEQFKTSAEATLDSFNREHNEMINARFPSPPAAGSDDSDSSPFLKAQTSLLQLLTNTRDEYARKSDEYIRYLKSKIVDSQRNAIRLLQEWLSNDYYELPYTLSSKSFSVLEASTYDKAAATSRYYIITKTSTVTFLQEREEKIKEEKEEAGKASTSSSGTGTANDVSSILYSLSISDPNLEFWNYRKRVADVDVKDVLIPFGLRTPTTEKIRQSLRFVPGLSKEPAEKEPWFVNVDGYYIVSAKLDDNDKTLSVQLANNPLELRYNVISIGYSVPELYSEKTSAQRYAEGKLPKIDCIIKDEERMQDVLLIKEIAEATDISKIILFGRALADKLKLLSDPAVWYSQSKLVQIQVDGKDAVLVEGAGSGSFSSSSSPPATSHQTYYYHYDPQQVTLFLETIAKNFAPLVRKLKQKSPVKGELILRYEKEDGSREEHTIKMEELNSLLSTTDSGRKISDQLLISGDNYGTGMTDSSRMSSAAGAS